MKTMVIQYVYTLSCVCIYRSRDGEGEPREPIVPCGVIANSWFNGKPL